MRPCQACSYLRTRQFQDNRRNQRRDSREDFEDISQVVGLYAGVVMGEEVKSNHMFRDTAFVHEQAKAQVAKTGLGVVCAFHADPARAPIGNHAIPKQVSARGDPTLMEVLENLQVDTTAYTAVLVGPKTGSTARGPTKRR